MSYVPAEPDAYPFWRLAEEHLRSDRFRAYFERGHAEHLPTLRAFQKGPAFTWAKGLPSYRGYQEAVKESESLLDQARTIHHRDRWEKPIVSLALLMIAALAVVLQRINEAGVGWFGAAIAATLLTCASVAIGMSGAFPGLLGLTPRNPDRPRRTLVVLGLALSGVVLIGLQHTYGPIRTVPTVELLMVLTAVVALQLKWRLPLAVGILALRYAGTFLVQARYADRAREEWLEESLESVIEPGLLAAINELLGEDAELLLVEQDSEGLRRLNDPSLHVTTRTEERVWKTLARTDSASIAISGPRGAGKTSLLQRVCESAKIYFYIQAPTNYVPKEFLTELFQRACERYLRQHGHKPVKPLLGPRASLAKLRVLVSFDMLRVYLSLALTGLVGWSAWTDLSDEADGAVTTARSHYSSLFDWGEGIWDRHRFLVQCLLLLLALALWPRERWRRQLRRLREPDLVSRARRHLFRLQVEKTATWGVSLPVLRNTGTATSTLKHLPWTMPELVGQLRLFLTDMAEEEARHGRPVLIAIDEVDRIGSVEEAARFISEIKAIFDIDNVFFLVSVAEEVASLFARRAIAGRSVFENAFSDVVSVGPLSLDEAEELLRNRVIGLTAPFIRLVYALSGGLPRELIRMTRRLIEVNSANGYHLRLPGLAELLVREEMCGALDGTRGRLSALGLDDAWGGVMNELRALQRDLETGSGTPDPVMRRLAELRSPTDEGKEAHDALVGLTTYALLGLMFVQAFRTPDPKVVELADMRRELSVSPYSCREHLVRMRPSGAA